MTAINTLRLVLALIAQLGLTVHQMDVETAFLYVKPPLGIEVPEKSNCFRLMKALYGLK